MTTTLPEVPQEPVDPIELLVTYLRDGRPPPLRWLVKWVDGKSFVRAWQFSWDVRSMAEVMGVPVPELERKNVLGVPMIKESRTALGIGLAHLAAVLVPSLSRIAMEFTAREYHSMVTEMKGRADAFRARYPEPPTLDELLVRYGIGKGVIVDVPRS